MKTQTGCYWAARQWMLRGGAGTIAWLLGPELDRAFVLVEKLFDGEPGNPAVFPPELVLSRPTSTRDVDPHALMLDRSILQVKHTGSSGKNLTARNVVWWLWTEAATTADVKNYVRLRGRIVQSKGQGYLDAVPEPRNWIKPALIDAAQGEADEAARADARGEPFRRSIKLRSLSAMGNPWVDEQEAREFMRDLQAIDPRIAAREGGGEWTGDADLLFSLDSSTVSYDFGPTDASSALERLGLEDCTEQASLRWFARPHSWICAVDVNAFPHTVLIGKLAVPLKSSPRVPRNWHAVFMDALQLWGVDSAEAAKGLLEFRAGRYRGAGVLLDATSTLANHNAAGTLNARKRIIPRLAFADAGFEVRGPKWGPSRRDKPREFANPDRVDGSEVCRMMLRDERVHIDRQTCGDFIFALRNQESDPDGFTPVKHPNTNQDRFVASFVECFRYWAWPFFSIDPATSRGEMVAPRFHG